MKPLKSLINKSNLKNASSGTGKWISASSISFLDLEDRNILVTDWGINYVYVPLNIAEDLIGHKIHTSLDHVFFRKDDYQYRCATLEHYEKTFPKNSNNSKLNIIVVNTTVKKFKHSNDLKEYLDVIMPKIILEK